MTQKFQTVEEFEQAFDDLMLDMDYADYIMDNCGGDRTIANGDQLLAAMEDFYLYEEFKAEMLVDNHLAA